VSPQIDPVFDLASKPFDEDIIPQERTRAVHANGMPLSISGPIKVAFETLHEVPLRGVLG